MYSKRMCLSLTRPYKCTFKNATFCSILSNMPFTDDDQNPIDKYTYLKKKKMVPMRNEWCLLTNELLSVTTK